MAQVLVLSLEEASHEFGSQIPTNLELGLRLMCHLSHIPLYLLFSVINTNLPGVISTWGVRNSIDFLSLSYTRHAEDIRHSESTSETNDSILKIALDHGKASGIVKSYDRVVVCQKVGDDSVVKIIELED
ncbi:pyruvate kinase 1, cytosolic-like protein [Tanacetum coccineum]